MRIQTRIWLSIILSLLISIIFLSFLFSVLRGMYYDLARNSQYGEIINKTFTLNTLIATIKDDPLPRRMRQAVHVDQSLGKILGQIVCYDSREEGLLADIQGNAREMSGLLNRFFNPDPGLGEVVEAERRAVLALQLWIKVHFITDAANRLIELSQARIVSAYYQTGIAILGLVVALILTNSVIYFLVGRSIAQDIRRLVEGVRHISGGDLVYRIPIVNGSEFADLARAFNGMSASLEASYSRLRRAMEKLERANQELQDFAYVASHDLQEPLRKIQTFGDRLKGLCGSTLSGAALDCVERMIKSADRMSALVQSLSTYSRITGRTSPFAPVDLTRLVKGTVGDLELDVEAVQGTVEVGRLPIVEADAVMLRHLFRHLIGNALKYRREEKPCIRIYENRHQSDGLHEIRVQDNGMGFDERYLDRIFKPFQRLHKKSDPYEGTGIGLALCRRIVEHHGGTITAQSKPGEGTTVIVSLPEQQSGGE